MNRASVPSLFGIAEDLRGAESNTSGVNLLARMVMIAGKCDSVLRKRDQDSIEEQKDGLGKRRRSGGELDRKKCRVEGLPTSSSCHEGRLLNDELKHVPRGSEGGK